MRKQKVETVQSETGDSRIYVRGIGLLYVQYVTLTCRKI